MPIEHNVIKDIVVVNVNDLKPAEYNPRQASESEAEALKESLKRFGFVDPLIVNEAKNRKNVVIGGHFRLKMAKELGYGSVPIVYVNIPDIERERELNLRLNKNLGSWDYNLLANFDEDMLQEVGFSSEELDKIFDLSLSGDKDPDKVPEKRNTNVKLGDLFELGNHRVMCGDVSEKANVAALMGEFRANMVFTDPPYNVAYQGMQNSKQWDSIENDNMSDEVFEEFLSKAFNNYYDFTTPEMAIYICHADKSHVTFRTAFENCKFEWRATIIWIKNSPAFNFAQYKYKHEPIFYCFKKGKIPKWYGDRTQTTLWEAKKEKGDHPTIKPVELIETAIKNSSKRQDIVADFFGGSGSTLIACEELNRRCFMMEIAPQYVQVIIDRWEHYTGKKAVKLNG